MNHTDKKWLVTQSQLVNDLLRDLDQRIPESSYLFIIGGEGIEVIGAGTNPTQVRDLLAKTLKGMKKLIEEATDGMTPVKAYNLRWEVAEQLIEEIRTWKE